MAPVKVRKFRDQEGKSSSPLEPALRLYSNRKVQIHRSVESDLCERLERSSALNEPELNMYTCGLIEFVIRRRCFVLELRFAKLNSSFLSAIF